jgi:hypothetical protein
MKLRVWWIPQVPMKPFYVDVASIEEGAKIIQVLCDYDVFQFENNVKPDYTNVGGLQMFDPQDDTDSPEGSWVDWCDEETGEDDPFVYLEAKTND